MRARFVNEEQKQGSLFRSTDQTFLIMLLELEGDPLKARGPGNFISLSRDSDSGGQDDFGGREIVIEFDENKIFDQGAEEIWYEPAFFEQFPEISLYVTGYKGEEDYYEQKGYSGPEEANEDMELTWDQYLEGYGHEEEIVMKQLRYVPGLIKFVDVYVPCNPILKDMLEEFDINHELDKRYVRRIRYKS